MLIAPGIYSVELGLISRTIPELLAFSRGTRTVANFWLLAMVGLMFLDAAPESAMFEGVGS